MNPHAPIFYPNNHYANNPGPVQWIPDGPGPNNVIQASYPPPPIQYIMVPHPSLTQQIVWPAPCYPPPGYQIPVMPFEPIYVAQQPPATAPIQMPPRHPVRQAPGYKSQETQTLKSKFRSQDGSLPMTSIVANNNDISWTQQYSTKPEVRSKIPEIRPAYQDGQVQPTNYSSPPFNPAYNNYKKQYNNGGSQYHDNYEYQYNGGTKYRENIGYRGNTNYRGNRGRGRGRGRGNSTHYGYDRFIEYEPYEPNKKTLNNKGNNGYSQTTTSSPNEVVPEKKIQILKNHDHLDDTQKSFQQQPIVKRYSALKRANSVPNGQLDEKSIAKASETKSIEDIPETMKAESDDVPVDVSDISDTPLIFTSCEIDAMSSEFSFGTVEGNYTGFSFPIFTCFEKLLILQRKYPETVWNLSMSCHCCGLSGLNETLFQFMYQFFIFLILFITY
jgi:hypothetical protein